MAVSSSRATKVDPLEPNFFPKDASLLGLEFATRCPPDISHRTRIIAVCGITDIGDLASPTVDGWFLSDFWMFNFLRGIPATNQIWLTCCDPKVLVDKYTRYAHGDTFQERRVVLEEPLLDTITGSGTLRVVEPKILLKRFLKTVETECKAAAKADQNVLLLVFGHGDANSYGVTSGSSSNTEFEALSAPILKINALKAAVGKKTRCSLLMTSCYSGGWAVQPDLNLTIIAAAGPERETRSWNTSASRGFSGSVVASAVRDAILASEINDANAYEELQATETWVEFSGLIHDQFIESDRFHDKHGISFAAQDDEWTKAWRERTGIPLGVYKDKWDELSILPAHADGFANRDPASAFADLSSSTLSMTMPQMYYIIRALAAGYANSFPGPDNASSNTAFHTRVRQLLSGEDRYDNRMNQLLRLGYTLSYRLENMTRATSYKDILGLDYLNCTACSVDGWTDPLYASKQKETKEKLSRFITIRNLIHDARIFSTPSDGQAYYDTKPEKYLAIAFVESQWTRGEVEQAISTLQNVHAASLVPRIEEVRQGRWFHKRADQILKPVRKTLRSMSPGKRWSINTSN